MESMSVSSLFSIEGKTALVTGGSRGIGRMIAQGYLENGARVCITARKAEACNAAAEELSAYGECYSIPSDLSTAEGRANVIEELNKREDKLDILVNNAGANWGAPLDEYPEDGFDKVMDLNVKGLFYLTRDILPLLRASATPEDPARIINIGSIDGISVPIHDNFSYSASKAAVHHMTHVLAVKLKGQNVTCNCIAPGPFESKMTEWMLGEYQGVIEDNCPLGRIGSPPDMAAAAIYLASRAGAYVNGTVIPVDGGIVVS